MFTPDTNSAESQPAAPSSHMARDQAIEFFSQRIADVRKALDELEAWLYVFIPSEGPDAFAQYLMGIPDAAQRASRPQPSSKPSGEPIQSSTSFSPISDPVLIKRFAKNVVITRKIQRVSQKKLSDMSGLAPSSLVRIERAVSRLIRYDTVRKIASSLSTTPEILLKANLSEPSSIPELVPRKKLLGEGPV